MDDKRQAPPHMQFITYLYETEYHVSVHFLYKVLCTLPQTFCGISGAVLQAN